MNKLEKIITLGLKGILICIASIYTFDYGSETYESYLLQKEERICRIEERALESLREKSEIQIKVDLNRFEIEKEGMLLQQKTSLINLENEKELIEMKTQFHKSINNGSNWNWWLISGITTVIVIGAGLYCSDNLNIECFTNLNNAIAQYFIESNKMNRDILASSKDNVYISREILRTVASQASLIRTRENLTIIDNSIPPATSANTNQVDLSEMHRLYE